MFQIFRLLPFRRACAIMNYKPLCYTNVKEKIETMQKYFSVGEAAKLADMTSETLRYYDRIGLVKPEKKDEWTKYRYYTRQDIVLLHTVRALQQMDLSLQEIRRVLAYDDLEKIIEFLALAEKKADQKIAQIQQSKAKIQLAKVDYEQKRDRRKTGKERFVQTFPMRAILLSDTLEAPTLDTLWNYLGYFYKQVGAEKDRFAFEDQAGIYTGKDGSRMFAVCTRYAETEGLLYLPAGNYLCADCTEEDRERVWNALVETAKREYGIEPEFGLQMIVVSGILQWQYQLQLLVEEEKNFPPADA